MYKHTSSSNINKIEFKSISFCTSVYSKCKFFDAKSSCTCMKENPGTCIQKEKRINESMNIFEIDKNEAIKLSRIFL